MAPKNNNVEHVNFPNLDNLYALILGNIHKTTVHDSISVLSAIDSIESLTNDLCRYIMCPNPLQREALEAYDIDGMARIIKGFIESDATGIPNTSARVAKEYNDFILKYIDDVIRENIIDYKAKSKRKINNKLCVIDNMNWDEVRPLIQKISDSTYSSIITKVPCGNDSNIGISEFHSNILRNTITAQYPTKTDTIAMGLTIQRLCAFRTAEMLRLYNWRKEAAEYYKLVNECPPATIHTSLWNEAARCVEDFMFRNRTFLVSRGNNPDRMRVLVLDENQLRDNTISGVPQSRYYLNMQLHAYCSAMYHDSIYEPTAALN